MSRWEQLYFGHEQFPASLTDLEIERFFTPSPVERKAVLQRRAPASRIAFALQLGFLKMTGRTLNSVELVPPAVLAHLGAVCGREPPRIASIRAFYRRRRTRTSLRTLWPLTSLRPLMHTSTCAGSSLSLWSGPSKA